MKERISSFYTTFISIAFLKKHRAASIIGVLAFLALVWAVFFRDTTPDRETAVVARKDIVKEVSATGKVRAGENVELAFEESARVARILVKEGDRVGSGALLAEQDARSAAADVAQAFAKLHVEEAALAEVERGTRSEEVDVQGREVANVLRDLRIEEESAYTSADDAIRGKADKLFESPGGYSPRLIVPVSDGALAGRVEDERAALHAVFASWKSGLNALAADQDVADFADTSRRNLIAVRDFLDNVTLALTYAMTQSITQSKLDAYRADISSARAEVKSALSELESAASKVRLERSELALAQAPGTPESVRKQEARVEDAKAALQSARARAAKSAIRAPFSGVVTDVAVKVGELARADTHAVSLQSLGAFEVEAFIPETNIALIRPGASAKVTLDSYPDQIWDAKVVSVNPAETVVDGVSTYKTVFQFGENDERIRSGLTANITITAEEKKGALSLPQRFVKTKDGAKVVLIKNPKDDSITEKTITVGISGSEGEVEIVGGLNEGEVAVLERN